MTKKSFLSGIAVGKQLKGWSTAMINEGNFAGYCTVVWYDSDGKTVLQASIVPVGGSIAYSGKAPTPPTSTSIFDGWTVSTTNVTTNLKVYPLFHEATGYRVRWQDLEAAAALGYYSEVQYGLYQHSRITYPNTEIKYASNPVRTIKLTPIDDYSFHYEYLNGGGSNDNVVLGYYSLYAALPIATGAVRSQAVLQYSVTTTYRGTARELAKNWKDVQFTASAVTNLDSVRDNGSTGYGVDNVDGIFYLPTLLI